MLTGCNEQLSAACLLWHAAAAGAATTAGGDGQRRGGSKQLCSAGTLLNFVHKLQEYVATFGSCHIQAACLLCYSGMCSRCTGAAVCMRSCGARGTEPARRRPGDLADSAAGRIGSQPPADRRVPPACGGDARLHRCVCNVDMSSCRHVHWHQVTCPCTLQCLPHSHISTVRSVITVTCCRDCVLL